MLSSTPLSGVSVALAALSLNVPCGARCFLPGKLPGWIPAERGSVLMHRLVLGVISQLYQAYCEAESHEVLMHLLALAAF